MFAVRRLFAVGSVLTLIGLLASTHLWGQAGKRNPSLLDSTEPKRPIDTGVDSYAAAEMSLSRFADQPLVLYHPPDQKETLLALQVKPQLKPVSPRPRDYLVLVDTAAHMAGGDLRTAQTLLNAFLRQVGGEDRVALWTVNTKHHDLTNGFQTSQNLKAALKKLGEEYPAGAVNLRDSLPEAVKLFDGKQDRQHVILFLGSGQSIAGPIDADLRVSLCKQMTANHIAFYSVPLGGYLDPFNLHGFANNTGGKVIRYGLGSTPDKWTVHLVEALKQPVLYDCEIQLPAKVAEVLPTKLPPLRPDVPTLVVGKFAAVPAKDEVRFDYTLTGKVNGEETRVAVSEKMSQPDDDNYFLANMLDQWRTQKDRPALLQADRALDFAFQTNQLVRADLVIQAEWALEKKEVDAAARLYQRALQADPTSARAKAGLKLVEDLRSGRKSMDVLKDWLKFKKGETFTRFQQGRRVVLPAEQLFADADQKDAEKKDKKDNPPLAPDQADQNRINEIRGRQAIIDQQQKEIADDAIRQANQMVLTRPDDAHEFLKRTLDGVRTNPDLSNDMRASLSSRLERAVQNVDIRGAVVNRDQEEALRLMAAANARATIGAQERMEQDVIRARMRVYHNLMDQAREQQAYRQAQAIRQDLIDQGLPVPPAVTAGYAVGLAGYHLREIQELRRIRQERWLAVLLEVERSHVPFPDEPPVEFPPAATWKALSELRKGRYESATFGADLPERGIRLRQTLSQEINYEGLEDARATLSDALDQLSKRYNLTFDINEKAFEMDQLKDVARTPVADPTPIPPMRTTLSTVLRKILRRVPAPSGTTYLIRRDVIEITTGTFAAAEKTVRVYPVADIVTPLPQAINPLSLMQSATIFGISAGALGGFAGIGGLAGLGAMGMRGGMAGMGGGMGGMAGMGGGLGGLGGIGGIAGLGGGGFNQLGVGGGMGGAQGFQGNFQGAANQGFGGVIGFGGQQLGQFGNLGGQFGLQGGDQSQMLLTLIRQVVGRPKDWAINFDPITGQPINPLDDQANAPEGLNQENNQLGFYPPAEALVVKGSATIHTRPSNLIINPNAAVAALHKRDPKIQVAGGAEERPDLDPRKVWQDALIKGVKNRGLIIATADFLVLANKFDHAVEFLKANLRQGIVVEPWVYKALAVALRLSGGSAEDIERAEVSTADMEPKNGRGYLEAATALAQDEKYGLALAFCRQAALLEPGLSHAYEEALGYAELARDPKAMQWAAGNLLGRDWPGENKPLHDRALQKIDALVKLLNQQGHKEDADRLAGSLAGTSRRDLVVKLSWQGDVDLDLHVIEPTGSLCSSLHRQSIGGGALIGDSLADMTSETYLAAEGFSGEYEIEIEKVWGHPLNNKAQLKIIHNQGTPEEREQLLTVELKSRHSERIKVKLENGRRTEAAYVPPPNAQKKPDAAPAAQNNPDKVLHKLRVLADPEVTGVGRNPSGDVVSQGRPVLPSQIKSGQRGPSMAPDNDRTLYQTRVKPFVQNALDVTASAVLSADRRSLRLSVTPVFNTVKAAPNTPVVVNPTIPGAR
jgi:hypothetical protein